MIDEVLAVVVPLVHFAFVVVLVGGAFVVWRSPRWWRFHLPAVVAMTVVSSLGADCPLTVLENHFRVQAGWKPHPTGFVSHYLVEPWHPAGITPPIRAGIIAIWLVPNVIAYVAVIRWYGQRRSRHERRGHTSRRLATPLRPEGLGGRRTGRRRCRPASPRPQEPATGSGSGSTASSTAGASTGATSSGGASVGRSA